MNLRPATLEDVHELTAWISDAAACDLWGGSKVRFPFTIETLCEDIQFDTYDTYSFVDDSGELLGFGQIIDVDDTRLHLARIIIDPRRRGEKLGLELCRKLIAQGVEQYGERNITLKVNRDNARAISLYKRLGFQRATDEFDSEVPGDAHLMILARDRALALRSSGELQSEL